MKKRFVKRTLCTLSFLLVNSCFLQAFDQTFNFSFKDFALMPKEDGTLAIVTSNHDYTYNRSLPGEPLFPFYQCRVHTSQVCNKSTLHYDVLEDTLVATGVDLETMSRKVFIGKNEVMQAPSLKASASTFPDTLIQVFNGPEYGTDYLMLYISPFVYEREGGKLRFVSKVRITYEEEESNAAVMQRSRLLPQYDYLIITADSLVQAFSELRDWKITKGVATQIVSLSTIHGSSYGTATPLEIKNYIKDRYTYNGVSMVLLGGAMNIVPSQTTKPISGITDPTFFPADMFYTCFDKAFDWDGNHNYIVGEFLEENKDNIDYVQELAITRLPVRSSEQARIYIRKLIDYERKPEMFCDSLRMLLSGSETHWTYSNGASDTQIESESLLASIDTNKVESKFFVDTRNDFGRVGEDTIINAENVSELINSFRPHWLSMECHGSKNYWQFNRYDDDRNFYIEDALNLQNDGRPMVITTGACHTADFTRRTPCLGEAFLFHPTGGAIAYFGSTFEGVAADEFDHVPGAAMTFCSDFWTSLDSVNHYGEAVRLAKNINASTAERREVYSWQIRGLNAFGDCEMPIYTEVPKLFPRFRIVVDFDEIHFADFGNLGSHWNAAYVSRQDHGETYFLSDTICDVAHFNGFIPCTVCVTDTNFVPLVIENGRYIGNADVNDLYLQNLTFDYDNSIVVYNVEQDVFIGRNVDGQTEIGDVTIENGATVFIDYEKKAVIPSGFKCKKGGRIAFNYHYL